MQLRRVTATRRHKMEIGARRLRTAVVSPMPISMLGTPSWEVTARIARVLSGEDTGTALVFPHRLNVLVQFTVDSYFFFSFSRVWRTEGPL